MVYILLTALFLDFILGEPPNAWHPVAWLGNLISREMKLAPGKGCVRQLVFGSVMVLATLGSVTALAYFLVIYLKTVNPWLYVVLSGLLLKFTFSLRGLKDAAQKVKKIGSDGPAINMYLKFPESHCHHKFTFSSEEERDRTYEKLKILLNVAAL